MKKLTFLGGAIGLGVGALLVAPTSHAADHVDAPAVGGALAGGSGIGQPLADINDVYAWMSADKSKVNLAMTISPGDDGTRHLSPNVIYVFHVTQYPSFTLPLPAGTETKVICQFASDTSAQCWVGNKGYITGDPSNATTGLVNSDHSIQLFAGRRSDPFFFNLQGFRNAVSFIDGAENAGLITKDAAGCPIGNAGLGSALRSCLLGDPNLGASAETAQCPAPASTPATAAPPCSTTSPDCFANLNVIGIVLQLDTSLVASTGNPILGVWASTHAAM